MRQCERRDDAQEVAGGLAERRHGLPSSADRAQHAGQEQKQQEGEMVVADPHMPQTLADESGEGRED